MAFVIKLNGQLLEKRQAWNASIRAIEKYARIYAKEEGETFALTASESNKDERGFHYVQGFRTWTGSVSGMVLHFTIEKV